MFLCLGETWKCCVRRMKTAPSGAGTQYSTAEGKWDGTTPSLRLAILTTVHLWIGPPTSNTPQPAVLSPVLGTTQAVYHCHWRHIRSMVAPWTSAQIVHLFLMIHEETSTMWLVHIYFKAEICLLFFSILSPKRGRWPPTLSCRFLPSRRVCISTVLLYGLL